MKGESQLHAVVLSQVPDLMGAIALCPLPEVEVLVVVASLVTPTPPGARGKSRQLH